MAYITFIITLGMLFLLASIYNKTVRDQNTLITKNNRDYDEDTPYKKFIKIPSIPAIIWSFSIGLFIIFIISRISLCGLSETEYKSVGVIIPDEELRIDTENNNYMMYVDGELIGFDMAYMKVIVDNSINTPHIKNYYARTTKKAVNNPNTYFLYNRKEDKVGEWKKTFDNCGCGGADLTLVLPKEYKIIK